MRTGAQIDVAYPKDDDSAQDERDAETSLLWPSSADGRSGMRDRPPSLDEPPVSVARSYELLEPLGDTAYGRAMGGRHMPYGREVALHFLEIDDEREARALPLAVAKCAQLSHPNVIALEGHGRDPDGTYYLVTEALEGSSLARALAREPIFALSRALAVTLQIGRALRAAHKLGIVHGALGPENVWLTPSEHGEVARVVGFGCATFRPQGGPGAASPYQGPERADGVAADTHGDVFALGCLVYRMLTGRLPSASEPVPSLANAAEEPIPRELDELVSECLAPRLEERLSDMVYVTRRLREIARSVNAESPEPALSAVSASSLPPADVSSAEGDVSGSLFGVEGSGGRSGYAWIVGGLALALVAVWLLWNASTRDRPETLPLRQGASQAP